MSYIETYSGKKICLINPDPEQFTLKDIFHALRNVPRFGGHTRNFYSVASHSVNVAALVPDSLKFYALLHDATEAYLMDMPTPYKALLPDYKSAEQRLWTAICIQFDMPSVLHPLIKQADHAALITERNCLKGKSDWGALENTLIIPKTGFIWGNLPLNSLLTMALRYKSLTLQGD